MNYKYTVLFGILFGCVMNMLKAMVDVSWAYGIIGFTLSIVSACCGCLVGYCIDKHKEK